MGFIAPVVSAIGSGLGAVGSAVAGGLGAVASGVGSVLGPAGVASGIGAVASQAGPLLQGILGGGGGGIGAPSVGGVGGGAPASGLGQLGQFLGDLIPTAAAFGVGESGDLDISNINVMTPEQATLLKALSERTLEAIDRPQTPASSLQQLAFGAAPGAVSDIGRPLGDVFEASVAQPARRAFTEELAPRLRASFGALGAGSSSAFNRQLARQARELESDLAAQRAGFTESARSARLADILNLQVLGGAQRDIGRFPTPALAALLGQPLQATQFQPVVQTPAPQPGAGALISQFASGGGLGRTLGGIGNFLGGLF